MKLEIQVIFSRNNLLDISEKNIEALYPEGEYFIYGTIVPRCAMGDVYCFTI
jgi:hypothetical protein